MPHFTAAKNAAESLVPMIVETSANQFYSVSDANDANLAHVWYGQRVKRSGGAFVPVAKLRTELVRKAGCRIVQQ